MSWGDAKAKGSQVFSSSALAVITEIVPSPSNQAFSPAFVPTMNDAEIKFMGQHSVAGMGSNSSFTVRTLSAVETGPGPPFNSYLSGKFYLLKLV